MASDQSWLSTKALSVYNVLLAANAELPEENVLALLQSWRPDITSEYVAIGASYLLSKGFVVNASGKLAMARPGARLKRVNGDIGLDWN